MSENVPEVFNSLMKYRAKKVTTGDVRACVVHVNIFLHA